MSAAVYVTVDVKGSVDSVPLAPFGNRGIPALWSNLAGGGVAQQEVSIANNATFTFWDATVSAVPTVDGFALWADGAVMVELQGTTAADSSHFEVREFFPTLIASGNTLGAGGAFAGATMILKKG
ncbi:MAG TPA: hypothetical protein VGH94_11170, partial [Acidimicrobiales bacterium]